MPPVTWGIEEGGRGGDHVLVRERAEDHLDGEEDPAGLGGHWPTYEISR